MKKLMKSKELDRLFDEGKDTEDMWNYAKATRPDLEFKRVNVDFPVWMVTAMDKEAQRLGIARMAVLKTWVADRIASRGDSRSQAA